MAIEKQLKHDFAEGLVSEGLKRHMVKFATQNNFSRIFCIPKFVVNFANGKVMHIISHRKIKEFYESDGKGDSRIALERWYDIAQQAQWHNLSEIREDFPATDYVGNQHYVFNIKGNNYRLVVVIKFTIGRIFIRFVGTHSEYDKIDCSTI